MVHATKAGRQEAREHLLRILGHDRTKDHPAVVYTVVKHVARSGVSRTIDLLVVDPATQEIMSLSWMAARVLTWPLDHDRGGIRVSGAGMDMASEAVYSLALALYDDGYALAKRSL